MGDAWQGSRRRSRRWRWAAPLGLLLALWLIRWAAEAGFPLPACGFRQATGLPCPGCGSTRALLALAGGDVAGAWRFNPLATTLTLGFALAGGVWITGRRIVWRAWGFRLLVVLIFANWLYLLSQGTD